MSYRPHLVCKKVGKRGDVLLTSISVNSRVILLLSRFPHQFPSSPVNITAEKEARHQELLHETVAVGVMFASKAIVQLLANPFVGPLTHR
jgi:hypothetical protein